MQISVDGDCDGNYTLQNLLIQKAKQKIDIKIPCMGAKTHSQEITKLEKEGIRGMRKKVSNRNRSNKAFCC